MILLLVFILGQIRDNLTTYEAALSEAKKRINDISKLKNIYISRNNFMGKRDKS